MRLGYIGQHRTARGETSTAGNKNRTAQTSGYEPKHSDKAKGSSGQGK